MLKREFILQFLWLSLNWPLFFGDVKSSVISLVFLGLMSGTIVQFTLTNVV